MNALNWNSANQAYLTEAVDVVRRRLQADETESVIIKKQDAQNTLDAMAEKMPSPPALNQLVKIYPGKDSKKHLNARPMLLNI